ncbi:MAG: AAA family ATPase [Acidobacteria bacterium]|nr:AAA family ATPase [Acidobacteriota bacterium]
MTGDKKARRIAVISGKGGVGKTVITANLAAALAASGQRVLVLDADLGLANLDIILGLDPKHTLQDIFRGDCRTEDALIRTAKGFDLLPAGSGLQENTVLSRNLADGLEALLAELDERYDIMLFDAGAGMGDVVLFFATLAHQILVVVTPEPTSLMDAYATIKVLRQLYERDRFLLVVNQANPERPHETGTSVARHLQGVISKFIDESKPPFVNLELIGSLPRDPAIPRSVRNRQLLLDAQPPPASAPFVSTIADSLRTRMT